MNRTDNLVAANSTDARTGGSSVADTRPAAPRHVDARSLKDVWSRSGSKYRVRAVVLLALNVLLFAGVGSFAYWLRSGVRFAPAQPGYLDELAQTFDSVGIVGRHGISLGSLLLEPISVQEVPMQIPILGLLMAALISIPILVAMLYRFSSSLPFVAVVGFLAVMPWLAATLLLSCVIASVAPFRTRHRFVSALLALVPVAVYLVLAWSGTTDATIGSIDPIDRIRFVAPWVLAIVASTVAFAVVLLIAMVVDYRPGAIAPLLAVMFVLPVALFEFYVGRDELYYRVLEARGAAHFADRDVSLPLEEQVQAEWRGQPSPRTSLEAVRERVETRWLFGLAADLDPGRTALAKHQAEMIERCDWFVYHFPDSPYAVNALFLKAQAYDMRVDTRAFRETRWIRFYDCFPNAASRASWRLVAANAADTLVGAQARLRLAQLNARDGRIDQAVDSLRTIISRLDRRDYIDFNPGKQGNAISHVLSRDSPQSSLPVDVERLAMEAHWLRDLLVNNRDPVYGYDPIAGPRRPAATFTFGLLDLNPRHTSYADNLRVLNEQYPNSQIEDNIELEMAKSVGPPGERVQRLERCLERFADRDAAPEIMFRLGVAYKNDGQAERGREMLAQLVRAHPATFWARRAAHLVPGTWPARRTGTS